MTLQQAEEEILYHRYLYYVKGRPVLTDYDYDMMERAYLKEFPDSVVINTPGSDSISTYPKHLIEKWNKK